MTIDELIETPEEISKLSSEEKEVFQYWYNFMTLSEPKKPKEKKPKPKYDEINLKTHTFASFSTLPAVIGAEEGGHALSALLVGGKVKEFGSTPFSVYTMVTAPNTLLSHTLIDLVPKLLIATMGFYLLRQGLKTKKSSYVGAGVTCVGVLGDSFLPYVANDVGQFVNYALPGGPTIKAGLTLGLASLLLLSAYSGSEILLRAKTRISNFLKKLRDS